MSTSGLRILRRISPPADLLRYLELEGQVEEILDKQKKSHYWISDDPPRDQEITDAIVGVHLKSGGFIPGCTDGFGIFDDFNVCHAFYGDAGKAQNALSGATVTFKTDVDVEQLPEADEYEKPDLPVKR